MPFCHFLLRLGVLHLVLYPPIEGGLWVRGHRKLDFADGLLK
jgi:hypothetical protein